MKQKRLGPFHGHALGPRLRRKPAVPYFLKALREGLSGRKVFRSRILEQRKHAEPAALPGRPV